MKKVITLVLCLSVVLCMINISLVKAETGLSVLGVEYYKEVSPGTFNRIYNLEAGTIKVHFDLKNLTGEAQSGVLSVQVKNNNEVVASQLSEVKSIENNTVSYLAADVAVPEGASTIEAVVVKSKEDATPLTSTYTFKKEDIVIVPDPGNATEPLSAKVKLSANGIDIPVRREIIQGLIGGVDTSENDKGRDSASRSFLVAKFSMSEGQKITLSLEGINGTIILDPLSVSPKVLEIPRYVTRGVGKIIIDKPQTLVIRDWAKQEGDGYEDIMIFITPLETDVPYKYAPNVTYFAEGVNTCPNNHNFKENEVLYFEKGLHEMVGLLNVKSGMEIYLAPGATLEAVVEGINVSDVKIFGRGILEARKGRETGKRARAIYFEKSKNVEIIGVGVRSPYEWQTLYLDCSNFLLEYQNIMGVAINNDGIDIDGVDNFKVLNNFVMSGDDAFGWHALKVEQISSEKYPFGRPTFDVYAQNNVIYNVRGGNPVRIGSSMEQESFKNVTIKDTYVIVTETGNGFHIDIQDWAKVSDMLVENFYVEEIMSIGRYPIRVEVLQGGYSSTKEGREQPKGLPSIAGSIENVKFVNFYAPYPGNAQPVAVGGYDENHTVKDLTFENVKIQTGTSKFTGGEGFAPLTKEQIYILPSTLDKKEYVKVDDITILP